MFWRDKEKETIKWSVLVLAVFILAIVCAVASLVFFWIYTSTERENNIENTITTIPEKVVNMLSEREIKDNYIKEINNLKVRIQELSKNKEELMVDAEYIFLSVSVPNELRDLHLKRFLEFKALEEEKVEVNELRIRLKEILNMEL
ncbi:MAG: hypothetical protein L3J07_00480 [Candidatus Magasanikbacteria bacterium]|nr:hypothetical protein [Candidatus Magasanikbacteria bacterium]